MWWFVKKLFMDENKVIYGYGAETRDISGIIVYFLKTDEYEIARIADGDSAYSANSLAEQHIYHLVHYEECPDERQIACG